MEIVVMLAVATLNAAMLSAIISVFILSISMPSVTILNAIESVVMLSALLY
jgi:hypothetical protein